MFTSYFLNKEKTKKEINELSEFLIKYKTPSNEKELLNYKEQLIKFLSYDFSWLLAEYKNTSAAIEENNKAISEDTERKNDDLYSKSYDLYYFHKNYLLAPYNLLILAHRYQFSFGQDFNNCIDQFKAKNKEIVELTKPKFKFNDF